MKLNEIKQALRMGRSLDSLLLEINTNSIDDRQLQVLLLNAKSSYANYQEQKRKVESYLSQNLLLG